MRRIQRTSIIFSISILAISICGCKKLANVPAPITSVNGFTVYNSDVTAVGALTGIYANLNNSGNFATGSGSISFFSGLSADEFSLFSGVATNQASSYYFRNQLTGIFGNNVGSDHWKNLYSAIYNANIAIEGISASTTLSAPVKQQLLGEASFVRGFSYFYLVNLFGDVPLTLTSDQYVNSKLSKSPKDLVWQQVIGDLRNAQNLLAPNYVDATLIASTTERIRPIKWAATAMLARAYLYTGNWAGADSAATAVIGNSALYSLVPLANGVFNKNSQEAIWQIQPIITGQNTLDGALFLLPATGPSTSFPVYLSSNLLNSFETGDLRRTNRNWVDSVKIGTPAVTYYFPYKYKAGNFSAVNGIFAPPTEYLMVLRLGEQYLIRSEARAQQNNLSGALSDLNAIRSRAGLPAVNALTTQVALLPIIQHERQVELFTEWGHRWLDLKRTGSIDGVMINVTPSKGGGSWNSYQQLYPILANDILYNSNLTQNPGY